MLQQVLIIKDDKIIYQRNFSKAISKEEFQILFMKLKKETSSDFSMNSGNYVSFDNRLTYIFERDLGIFFIFLSGLVDEVKDLEEELDKLKDEFKDLFGEVLEKTFDSSLLEVLNPIVDSIHSNLRPKISLVGFSGVGKTTTTKLIKEEEIPIEHVPTITGARAIIKIGKLQFVLWDFAGQEQFSFLWNNFVKGSDACLIITDSTLENVEKSKFFIELIKEEAPYANSAVIANKQDLSGALKTEEVERIMGLKTYAMVAIDPKNRAKMIRIISDVLEISTDVSPLLKPIYDRDLLILDAQRALERGEYANALSFFEKLSDLCLEIGDDSLGKQFYEKAENLRKKLSEEPPLPAQAPEIMEQPELSEITEPEPHEITEPEPHEI
ncbi:MAG: ADP-ribosylation factor-like protein, partial [Candidatus Hodarchaeota archaeon]